MKEKEKVIERKIEKEKDEPPPSGINLEPLVIKSIEEKILDSKLDMNNIYNIIGGTKSQPEANQEKCRNEENNEKCQSEVNIDKCPTEENSEKCKDEVNEAKTENNNKKEDAEVDRSRRSKYFKIGTPEKHAGIKSSPTKSPQIKTTPPESEPNQKTVTDLNYIEFMHPLRSSRNKTKTDENSKKDVL